MSNSKCFREINTLSRESSPRNITSIHDPTISNYNDCNNTGSCCKLPPSSFLIGLQKCSQSLNTIIRNYRIRSQTKSNNHKDETPIHRHKSKVKLHSLQKLYVKLAYLQEKHIKMRDKKMSMMFPSLFLFVF